MRYITLSILVLVCALLTSCATGPVRPAERHPVSPSRVFAHSLLTPSADRSARFTIVRDRGYTGSAAGIDAFVDGQRIARLAAAEAVTIYTTPGRHMLGARFSWGPVGPAEREFTADPQRPLTVRIFTESYSSSLDLRPESGYLYQ
jgi:hypothetical protein